MSSNDTGNVVSYPIVTDDNDTTTMEAANFPATVRPMLLPLLKPIFSWEGINDNGDDDHPDETRLTSLPLSSSYKLGFDLISITYFSVDFVFLTCR